MSSAVRGFPDKFPVRDDDRRPLRYRTASFLGRVYIRVLSRRRLRILGADNIPPTGPLLLACNHISNLDPLVVGGYFPHTLFAMAKRELYVNRFASWFLAGCNCIPVDRDAPDRRAVTRALSALRGQGRLLIFVEGTRSRDGTMHRAEPGVGFLARRSGAQVLPASITGTDGKGTATGRSRGRREVVLRYGAPFTLEIAGRRDDGAIADEIAAHIAALLPPGRRGVYSARTPAGATAFAPPAAEGPSARPA